LQKKTEPSVSAPLRILYLEELIDLNIDPFLDRLRKDRRFLQLIENLGLPQYQAADQKLALSR
jgi:hypothetical protein